MRHLSRVSCVKYKYLERELIRNHTSPLQNVSSILCFQSTYDLTLLNILFLLLFVASKNNPVFLRLRASEAKRRSLYCSAFTSVLVFFSRDIPSAFVIIEGYFLRAYFSATIQTFQKETQLDALSKRVKTFRKFSTGAILLASKARNFRKFLGFFLFANHSELARCRY